MEVEVPRDAGGGVLKRGVVLGHELAGVKYVLGRHYTRPNPTLTTSTLHPNTTPLVPLAHLVAHLFNGAGLGSE